MNKQVNKLKAKKKKINCWSGMPAQCIQATFWEMAKEIA